MSHHKAAKVRAIQEICGHTFENRELIESAITHPSAAEGLPVSASYERLEFLGDSVLGAIVAESLFKSYPQIDEGKLTRLKISLVSGETLSEVGAEIGLADCIVFGASEEGTGARGLHSALENVYEALVGALYLDGGRAVAEDFIMRTLKPHLATERAERPSNPKSFLQECIQRAPRAPRTARLLPRWCSWAAFALVAARALLRRRPRRPRRATRSNAWALPKRAS